MHYIHCSFNAAILDFSKQKKPEVIIECEGLQTIRSELWTLYLVSLDQPRSDMLRTCITFALTGTEQVKEEQFRK